MFFFGGGGGGGGGRGGECSRVLCFLFAQGWRNVKSIRPPNIGGFDSQMCVQLGLSLLLSCSKKFFFQGKTIVKCGRQFEHPSIQANINSK